MNSNAFTTFDGVESTHPNYEAINYIQAQNIVDGYPDGTFRPDNPINRAEFTKIIIAAYYPGQAAGSDCFPDVGTEWFAKYICFAKTHDVLSGYPDGNFLPGNNINFVEIAKILVNVQGFTVLPDADPWYTPYVEKLAEAHAIPASISSFDQKVTRGEMAEMIYRMQSKITNKSFKTYEELVIENAMPGLPVRLKIPKIQVDAAVEYVGLTPDGAMGVPQSPDGAAWFELGRRPGAEGTAVIAGHYGFKDGSTFDNLSQLRPGDTLSVEDDKGVSISFVVRESRSYDEKADASEVFYSHDGKSHLNLITCEGVWNNISKSFSERRVIFTDKE